MTESIARRLFQLVEPVAVVTYMAEEPTAAVMALGPLTMWDALTDFLDLLDRPFRASRGVLTG